MYTTVYATTTLLNFTKGPTKSAGRWLSNIKETIADTRQMLRHDDAFLSHTWGDICDERAWEEEHERNNAARERYIQNLDLEPMVQSLGENVALNRWLSYPRGEREKRSSWTSNLLILLMWALSVGAVSRQWQVFRSAKYVTPLPVVDVEAEGLPADGPCPAAAAATAHCPLKEAGENMTNMYKRCKNQMHVCLELAANVDLKWASRIIGIPSEVTTRVHGVWMQQMRKRKGVEEFWFDAATWAHITEIHEYFDILLDLTKLREMGLSIRPPSKLPGAVSCDDLLQFDDRKASLAIASRFKN